MTQERRVGWGAGLPRVCAQLTLVLVSACAGHAETNGVAANSGVSGSGAAAMSAAGAAPGSGSAGTGAEASADAGDALAQELAGAELCARAVSMGAQPGTCVSCNIESECCSASTSCGGEGGAATIPADCGLPVMPTSCEASAASSTLSGLTSLGNLQFDYAWTAETYGFSNSLTLFFTASAAAERCDTESLGLTLSPADAATADYVGTYGVPVMLRAGGRTAFASALLRITGKDASFTRGSLEVRSPGWSFAGTFAAPACAELNYRDDGK
jgi:hypothetical protein